MTDKVISLCAGYHERWDFPVLKQLIKVYGEPLLARTIRQMVELGRSVIVASHEPSIRRIAKLSIHPIPHRWTVETLYNTRNLWDTPDTEQLIVLLGDVIYSDTVLKNIVNMRETRFIGSLREIYAMTFTRKDMPKMLKSLEIVIDEANKGKNNGRLWNLYYDYMQLPKHYHTEPDNDPGYYVVEDRFTQDFDVAEDYHKFIRLSIGIGR